MADRIEREIEEILKKIDRFVPEKARRPVRRVGQPFATAQGWLAHRLARISLNQVMMWALIVFVVAFFLKAVPFFFWLMLGSLIIFATAFLLSALSRRPGTSGPAKRWRGQLMDLSGPSWADKLKAWLKGRKRV